jgi:flagellar motor switch protein FliM
VSKILSQDEVDALLQGMSDGEVAAELEAPAAAQAEAVPYDFMGNFERASRLGMPTFDQVNDRFAGIFQDSLGAFVRRKVEVSKQGTELLRFDEFLRSLIVPTSLNIWRPQPLRGSALLVLGSKFVFNVVEIFFGGKGGSDFKIEGRDFTAIEQRLVGKLVQIALRDMAKAWEGVHPLQPQMVRSEINPQFVKVVAPTENVVVTTFVADLHNASGRMQVCIPLSTLDSIRAVLSASFQDGRAQEEDCTWQRQLAAKLREVPVEVVVELGRMNMKSRDLMALRQGEVIILDCHMSSPVVAKVAGVPKLEGFIGQLRGNKAFQVSSSYTTNGGK